MPDTFAITLFFIGIGAVIGAFVKGRAKDLCLVDFSETWVTLEKTDGKAICGKLCVENSSLELVYKEPYAAADDEHIKTSYILYKNEYDQIRALVCCVNDMSARSLEKRGKDLSRVRYPRMCARVKRKTRNFFGTIRDSILEVIGLFVGRIKSTTPVGNVLKGQDEYVSKLKQQAVASVSTSYEPVLEKYIGRKVVLEIIAGDEKKEHTGILKDYTTEFIEILDARYEHAAGESRKADLIFPRTSAIVRHLGE